jgi:transposase
MAIPSDLTDEEWTHVEPLIPPAKDGSNRRRVNVREVVNGIMSILRTGCQWRAIPKDLPPRSTVFDYLDLWSATAPWIECIMRSMLNAATAAITKRVRPLRGMSCNVSGLDLRRYRLGWQ